MGNKESRPSIRSGSSEGMLSLVCRRGYGGIGRYLVGLAFFVTLFMIVTSAPSAFAGTTHVNSGVSFGPEGKSGAAEFAGVQSIAVDGDSGDVYVLDGGTGKIYKFDAEGEPVDFSSTGTNVIEVAGGGPAVSQIAVAPAGSPGGTAGDIYLANNNEEGILQVYGPTGALLGEPKLGESEPGSGSGEVCGVAVSPSGRVFVSVFGVAILEYAPSANPPIPGDLVGTGHVLGPGGNGEGICNVDADGAADIYGAVYSGGLFQLEGIADATPTKLDPRANTLGVDPTSDDVYADREDEIVQYSQAGEELGVFGAGEIAGSLGVAPLADGAEVYVGTPTAVDIFGPGVPTPEVTVGPATDIGEQSAILHGVVNPVGGPAATCEFEYLDEEGIAAFVPCEPAGPFTGSNDQAVTAEVTGLVLARQYRFRLIGTNSNGSSKSRSLQAFETLAAPLPPEPVLGPCPNDEYRIGAGSRLPACRAYEQVTPSDKNGMSVQGLPDWLVASSESGEPRATFYGGTGTGIPAGGGGRQDYSPMLSSKEGGSWSTRRLFPPETSASQSAKYLASSENLEYALVESEDTPNLGEPGTATLDLIDAASGSITPIAVGEGQAAGFAFNGITVADDGSYAFFESTEPVLSAPGAAAGVNNLYRWDRATNSVSVVGVLPAGEGGGAPPGGAFGAAYSWYETEELSAGGAKNGQYVQAVHAVGPGGDEIYFTAGQTGQIYLRSGLDGPSPTTAAVSSANDGVVDPVVEGEYFGVPFPAAFQEATPDGSRAFFISKQKLTADASTGPYDEGKDLYVYDTAASPGHALVDITAGLEGPESPNGAEVQGLLGTNSAGTIGYFVGDGDVAAGASEREPNIYRFETDGAGGYTITFVATLSSSGDQTNWSDGTYPQGLASAERFEGKTSRVSQNGEELVFTSLASLTGYNNDGCGATASPTLPCTEIFLYSQQLPPGSRITCISCDPSGKRALGDAALTATFLNVSVLQLPIGGRPEAHLTRNLSADGERIFFQTPDPLVAGDENTASCRFLKHTSIGERALPTCIDVYEWEAPGAPGGSCTKVEVDGGCLYLLSSGDSADLSDFVDASSDGSNVFIATQSQLVPADHDQLYDLYDARTDGGLAGQFTRPAAACEGEGCKSGGVQPNSPESPGTSSFAGPGNPRRVTAKCKKNQVTKHGKCVKKKSHKKKKRKKKNSHTKAISAARSTSDKGGRK